MMQYMTNSYLPATPHKVGLNDKERYSFAYFHEPNFQATCKPLPGYNAGQAPAEGIHYGTHFTNMFLRNYPDRITTHRLMFENRYAKLSEIALNTMPDPVPIAKRSQMPRIGQWKIETQRREVSTRSSCMNLSVLNMLLGSRGGRHQRGMQWVEKC
jgi:hypothetical protein